MNKNFKFLFDYLEKKLINIDKAEFEYQIQSHPEYPSLLAISDTLTFFNIENSAISVNASEIELLPNLFVALLSEDSNIPQLYFIEKKGEKYFCTNGNLKTIISKQDLVIRWQNIAFLIEKTEFNESKNSKNKESKIFSIFCILFLIIIFFFVKDIKVQLFLIFPILGVLLSIIALKDLFGAKSKLIDDFCNLTTSSSCNVVIESNKWKVFEWVNFSDLSIIFFTTQLICLFVFILTKNTIGYFNIQSLLTCFSIPIILLSVYFQKYVEKKWCPICLLIISIVLFELIFLLSVSQLSFVIFEKDIIIFLLILVFISLIWIAMKKLLTSQKKLKEFQLQTNRFIRNYEVFKNNLIYKKKNSFPKIPIVLGNKESKTIITIISNPFCGHCKKVHEIVERILENHSRNIKVQIIFKTDLVNENEENQSFYRSIYKLFSSNDEKVFLKAIKYWFDNTDLKDWFNKYDLNPSINFDETIQAQYNWSELNGYNFTPAIFINGYQYPDQYERENLEYFINDLIEDEL